MVKLSEIRMALKGLPIESEEIFNEISSHTEIIVNPKKIVVGWGSQRWGSGGYNWYTEVYLGNLKEHKLIDAERFMDQFIEYTKEIYEPDFSKSLVVYTHEYDCIDSSGHRCFRCVLYVVNPNLKSK